MDNIVLFSGGKDSTAMLFNLLELHIRIDRIIFCDTTLEFPEMYDFIKFIDRKINTEFGKNIEIFKPKTTFDKRFYGIVQKGQNKGKMRGFPMTVGMGCYWKRESKVKPARDIIRGNNVFIGIAYDEPHRIKDYAEYNAIYPLYDWKITEAMCKTYCLENGILNPLYEKFNRLGCYLCPKQSIKSLKVLRKEYPKLRDKLRTYEKSLTGNRIFSPGKNLNNI